MTVELHSLSPLQLQVKGSFVLTALMVRCGFIELLCVDGAPAFFKLATGPAKPPIINHVFSSALSAPKRSRAVAVGLSAAHLPWGRTPEYTHTNTHWAGDTAGPLDMQGRERACSNRIVC